MIKTKNLKQPVIIFVGIELAVPIFIFVFFRNVVIHPTPFETVLTLTLNPGIVLKLFLKLGVTFLKICQEISVFKKKLLNFESYKTHGNFVFWVLFLLVLRLFMSVYH